MVIVDAVHVLALMSKSPTKSIYILKFFHEKKGARYREHLKLINRSKTDNTTSKHKTG